MRRRNTANSQNLNGVWLLTKEEMDKIGPLEWQKAIRKAIEWENKYAALDGIDQVGEEAMEVQVEVPDQPMDEPEPVEAPEMVEVQPDPEPQLHQQQQQPIMKCNGNHFSYISGPVIVSCT